MPPAVTFTVMPTGGAVLMQFPGYPPYVPVLPSGVTTLSIQRAVSGSTGLSAFTQVYSGLPLAAFLDVNDGEVTSSLPLDASKSYVWQVGDDTGATQFGPFQPVNTVETLPDQLSQILIRLLQGFVSTVALPAGFVRLQLTTEMPQGGWQAMPYIVVNLDLIQQWDVGIGEDVNYPAKLDRLNWTLWSNAKRIWRVSVLSADANERDFWRDSLLSAFRVIKAVPFAAIGYDVSHRYQAASYTEVDQAAGIAPGFYGADLMFEITGVFPTTVVTNYQIIESITATANVMLTVTVP